MTRAENDGASQVQIDKLKLKLAFLASTLLVCTGRGRGGPQFAMSASTRTSTGCTIYRSTNENGSDAILFDAVEASI